MKQSLRPAHRSGATAKIAIGLAGLLALLCVRSPASAQMQPSGMAVDDKALFTAFQGGWWTRTWDVPSPANKGTRKVQVFLPPDYFTSAKRYPVIYFYHGITGWVRDPVTVRQGLIPAVAKGVAVPAIYVAPDLVRETMCADSKDGKIMSETFAVKELIPFIDANFRTIPNQANRAVEGNSMGGFCSLLYHTKYPHLFGSVTPYCPALHDAERFNSGMDAGHDLGVLVGKKMYNNDLSYARMYNPWNTWNLHLEELRKVPILIMTGQLDFEFARRGREFTKLLADNGVNVKFVEVPGAPHGVGQILPKLSDPLMGYVFHTMNFRRGGGVTPPVGGTADAGAGRDSGATPPPTTGQDAQSAVADAGSGGEVAIETVTPVPPPAPSPGQGARADGGSSTMEPRPDGRTPPMSGGCSVGVQPGVAAALVGFIALWRSRRRRS